MTINLNSLPGPLLTDDTESILTIAEASVLVDNYEIPYYDPDSDLGYQREAAKGRISKLAKKLYEKDTDLPTLVVANIRKLAAANHFINGTFKYSRELHGPLYIADGQHRILALEQAIEIANENGDETNKKRLMEKKMPVLISFTGDSELIEMKTFYSINKNAKNVPINDAAMILHRRYQMGDAEIMEEIDSSGEQWKIIAGEVAKYLNRDCSVWKNRIKKPGQRLPSPNITFAAMVNHLKPFVQSPDLEGKGSKVISKVVCAYWEGIAENHRALFSIDNAKNYAIQTSSATEVLHRIWENVRAKIQNSDQACKELTDKNAYESIMGELINSCSGRNGNGEEDTTGRDYWLKGKLGVAGQFTSNSAKGIHVTYLKGKLTEI